jgi:hypothetical protein
LRDFMQRFAAKPLGDLGQGRSLRIRQPQPSGQLGTENAILGDQVLVAQQQFLVNESRHEGQQPCPMESIAHGRRLIITTSGSTADPPAITRVFLPNAHERRTAGPIRFGGSGVATSMLCGGAAFETGVNSRATHPLNAKTAEFTCAAHCSSFRRSAKSKPGGISGCEASN